MTDTTANPNKIKALELANAHLGEKPADIVARATAYHAFLAGAAAPAGAATTNKTPPAGGATTNKPGAGTPGAGTPKPDAAKVAADKKAAEKAAADKAKGATGGAGNKPAAGAPTGAAVAPDTKAPGGKNTYAQVVDALRKVKEKTNKDDAIAILVEDGGGAKSVRDLKPALYDAVVEACNNVLADEGASADGAAGGVEDPTAQEPRDELGL